MKRSLITVAILLIITLAADTLRVLIEGEIFAILEPYFDKTPHFFTAHLITRTPLYALIFLLAGALASLRFHSRISALAAGLAVSTIPFIPNVIRGDVHAMFYVLCEAGNKTFWLNTAAWANWFVPPVAGTIGALLASKRLKLKTTENN